MLTIITALPKTTINMAFSQIYFIAFSMKCLFSTYRFCKQNSLIIVYKMSNGCFYLVRLNMLCTFEGSFESSKIGMQVTVSAHVSFYILYADLIIKRTFPVCSLHVSVR